VVPTDQVVTNSFQVLGSQSQTISLGYVYMIRQLLSLLLLHYTTTILRPSGFCPGLQCVVTVFNVNRLSAVRLCWEKRNEATHMVHWCAIRKSPCRSL